MTTETNKLSEITCQATNLSFKIARTLGNGGYSTCYEVYSSKDGKRSKAMACKAIGNKVKENVFVQKENSILKDLDHKNILRWIAFFSDEVNSYILTELCEEGDMYEFVRMLYPLPDSLNRSLLYQAFEAIDYVHHKGIIHRDIKPDNFFITADLKVKLGDFGMAIRADCVKDAEGLIFGTPGYLSPEMVKGLSYGKATDIWSFGCLAYFVLTNGPLEFITNVIQKSYRIPKSVNKKGSDLIKQLLRVEFKDRLSSTEIKTHHFFQEMNEKDDKINKEFLEKSRKMEEVELFLPCSSNANGGHPSDQSDNSFESISEEDNSITAPDSSMKNLFWNLGENDVVYFSCAVHVKCFARRGL